MVGRSRIAPWLLTMSLVVMSAPAVARSEGPDLYFIDAGCYDGAGQVMDQSAAFPTLLAAMQYLIETDRNLDDADIQNGLCSGPVRLNAVWRISQDGSVAQHLLPE